MVELKRINLILGKTGTGKSFLAKKIFKFYNDNVIVFDVMDEYEGELICNDYKSFLITLKQNISRFKIIVKTSDVYEIKEILIFIFLHMKNVLLILEETGFYLTDVIDFFVNYGRHKNIKMIIIVRRASELNTQINALVEKLFIFKTTSEYDLLYYKRIFGLN